MTNSIYYLCQSYYYLLIKCPINCYYHVSAIKKLRSEDAKQKHILMTVANHHVIPCYSYYLASLIYKITHTKYCLQTQLYNIIYSTHVKYNVAQQLCPLIAAISSLDLSAY